MREIKRTLVAVVLIVCAIGAYFAVVGWSGAAGADQADTACYKIAGCTCNKGKAHGDKTRSHEPTTADYDDNNVPKFQPHVDVSCSVCNKDGAYYCPVEGKNRK